MEMTITGLLKEIKGTVERCIAEMRLPVNPTENEFLREDRAPDVYVMNLPEREDLFSRIPYILIQPLDGDDSQKEGEQPYSQVKVRLLIALYNKDAQEGGLQALEIIERLRVWMQKGRLLANQYMLQMPWHWEFYEDDTGVYHLGEIRTVWSLPEIKNTNYIMG